MPKLLADGREFAISADAWDAWKEAAEPFELPDDVLRRVLGVGAMRHATPSSTTATLAATSAVDAPAHSATPPRSARRAHKPGAKRSRVPSNLLLPESEYELPILQALAASDGRRPTREVVEDVGRALDGRLTEVDREPMRDGEPPRWQNRVQFARLRLVKAGLMKPDSPRGVWEISSLGEQRLQERA
jgi:hypothetical protein